jgi:hypothetical protein
MLMSQYTDLLHGFQIILNFPFVSSIDFPRQLTIEMFALLATRESEMNVHNNLTNDIWLVLVFDIINKEFRLDNEMPMLVQYLGIECVQSKYDIKSSIP